MNWHQHKFGKWQKQAVYANGQEDPNKKKSKLSELSEKYQRKKKINQQKKAIKSSKKSQSEQEEKKPTRDEVLKTVQKKGSAKYAYKYKSELTDNDIANVVKRLENEQKLSKLAQSESVDYGKRIVNNLVALGKTGNDLYAVYTSPLGQRIREQMGFDVSRDRRR